MVTGARMTAASRQGRDGPVVASLEDGRELTGDEILVAVGRTEAEARAAGIDVAVVATPTGDVPGAYPIGEGVKGTSQLVIDMHAPPGPLTN